MTEPLAVRAEGLTKRYGALTAVNTISMQVAQGEVYGVLGPNGAGKTTFLRMLFGLIRANSGRLEVFGRTWARHATHPARRPRAPAPSPPRPTAGRS